MDITQVRLDWQDGLTCSEIERKHSETREKVFAVLHCVDEETMTDEYIERKLELIKPGMTLSKIEAVMVGCQKPSEYHNCPWNEHGYVLCSRCTLEV